MQPWLIIGAGDVAARMIPLIGHRVRLFALCRHPEKASFWRSLGVIPIVGDLDNPNSLKRIAGIAHGIFHFAPPNAQGINDFRTRHLISALSRSNSLPQRLIYISTTGVYGDHQGRWVDETTPTHPTSGRAKRRVDAENQLRQFAKRKAIKLTILRAPGIYAENRLPLTRLIEKLPLIIAEEDTWSNHIHALDLARAAVLSMYQPYHSRVYNVVDNQPMQIGEFYDYLADFLKLSRAPRLTKSQVKTTINEISWSFMAESRKIANLRLVKELSFEFLYPSVLNCLAKLNYKN
ncbi:MAG: NAD(P)-dependent oxidoreductase [Ferrovum sp. 37-45-19]|jgi:nucleoside-diphosphate-sugar epimerase|uniref:SDR family oxidoreductase n=1 Tax=Ferrovum sp. JA12 TaxID=1356299 RepID=UPI0007034695|nr:SDR family oxidoreductase [Ferrovum sp. JA12]OYV79538.1 MAG: NAD(P)-dependent oxidoreductase [Ferrovum sp. 21-44-67]OYV94668.1 MAG: NAD(P)-dependent oxidoreductase [Ferrovum sp. 37-45-19]OZB34512.1 MAG: NAD(P)-dependent oxidoreductase [Ferrovum sp. 34-44-207]HQT81456.1 SDR family oxidoreductase [Ferrovaceae bacterium]KRH79425.1 NAD dependent epimerase/dehydratase family protein [Ferrovum sp. JA12]